MSATLRKLWICVLAGVLATLAGPAFALGLGRIQVKSQINQPLLAEIPVISNDPAELDQLQARLASPDTFARIGLEAPRGVVSDLHFTVGLDARGQPVIRVTSSVPVQQPLLTFLVEVDWGLGRLVRLYSALLDTPRTVAAPMQPPIEAPLAAPSNTILRAPQPPTPAPEPAAATAAAPVADAAAANAPASVPADSATETTPVAAASPEAAPPPPANEIAPPPPAAAAATGTASAAAAAPVHGEYGPVKAGDTLSKLAGELGAPGYSLDQTMLALLRANPDAFINDNINLIKRGAVLRMPQPQELSQYSAAQAAVVVHEQIGHWREMRRPLTQPAALAGVAAAIAAAPARPVDPAAASRTPRRADARLEIVPPSASSGRRAGTKSGIETGGEGDMLRQQELQQAKETLAARDGEIQELKTRLAEMEKLQHEQQQLIALKDGKLAEVQQNLAAGQKQATATTATPPPPAAAPPQYIWPWAIAMLALVLLLGWWLMRRKPQHESRAPRTSPRPSFDTATLAASLPQADDAPVPSHVPRPPAASSPAPRAPVAAAPSRAPRVRAAAAKPAPAPAVPPPTWHAVDGEPLGPARAARIARAAPAAAASHAPAPAPAPEAEAAAADVAPTAPVAEAAAAVAEAPAAPAGAERIELARAYLDLGDVDTARSLLREVVDGDSASARDEALRLLRGLA